MGKLYSAKEAKERKESAQVVLEDAKKKVLNGELADHDSDMLFPVLMPVLKRTLKGHVRKVQALGWNKASDKLIAADQGGKVMTWLPKRGAKTQYFDKTFVMATEFHPTSDIAAIGGMDNMTTIIDVSPSLPTAAKKREFSNNGHDGYVASLHFLPTDPSQILSAGGDGDVILWDVEKAQVIRKFFGHKGDANSIRFPKENPGKYFCTASTDGTCRVWDVSCKTQGKGDSYCGDSVQLFEASGECNGAAFFPSGGAVAACCQAEDAFLWDMRTLNRLQNFKRKGSKVSACDFSSSGRIFYCAYEDGNVGLWDTFGKGGIKQKVDVARDNEANNKVVSACRVSPDGSAFATGAYDSLLKIFAPA